jgi:hypothetical protein
LSTQGGVFGNHRYSYQAPGIQHFASLQLGLQLGDARVSVGEL